MHREFLSWFLLTISVYLLLHISGFLPLIMPRGQKASSGGSSSFSQHRDQPLRNGNITASTPRNRHFSSGCDAYNQASRSSSVGVLHDTSDTSNNFGLVRHDEEDVTATRTLRTRCLLNTEDRASGSGRTTGSSSTNYSRPRNDDRDDNAMTTERRSRPLQSSSDAVTTDHGADQYAKPRNNHDESASEEVTS